MEMKATHKLRNRSGDQWLLCAAGKTHWFNKLLNSGEYKGWQGPLYGSVEVVYSAVGGFSLTKLPKFKGNK